MLTDYSVLISESYDGQHKLLTEELKRNGFVRYFTKMTFIP